MNGDPDRKTWVERPNQPPKPECCRTEGQAQAPATAAEDRTTVWKHTQGDSQAASGSRTPLKQFSLETIQNNAGGDGVVSPELKEYEKNLESNLADLVRRLKNKSYRARLVRRKYIPKGNGKLRPLGIPTLEEKLAQSAAAQILSAIYEADFLECSYGYRPGRNPLQAVRALTDALH